ncbi:MAG TPA: flippase activity-associated protein Agl23, partial [Chloroflexota bacterium]|nr:flippase activity-associated protein Agl23 [Chloroflexota bacterium]
MATEQTVQPRGRARPASEFAVQAPVDATQALTGEVVGARVSPIEWALYGAFTLIGAIMRFWDLGTRALHHDESLHATYSWYLWECLKNNVWQCVTGGNPGAEYHYDPMMHGPYQFHGNALIYLVFGPTITAARMNAAICGTALIILPILLRRQLGRVAALILSGLLAFSPAFLYYSRFSREDIYFALWTAVFFVGFIRWLDARGRPGGHRWLYMAAAGLALSWATKESTYFTIIIAVGFVVGVFAVAYAYQFLAPARRFGKRGEVRDSMAVATLGTFSRANLPPLLAAFRGTPARAWWYSLAIIAAITLVLFWPLGDPAPWGFIPGAHTQTTTNAQGKTVNYNTDFLTGGLSYWKLQQAVQRGAQPWYYYFLVIPLYEQVAVVFGAAGLVYYFLQKRTRLSLLSGAAFVLFTALTLFVGPALAKGPHYGLALLMVASGVVLLVSQPRSLLINLFLWWTVMTWALYIYAGEKMPWLTLHILLPTYVIAALYLGHLFRAPRWSAKWL